jgi:hypothetical protein
LLLLVISPFSSKVVHDITGHEPGLGWRREQRRPKLESHSQVIERVRREADIFREHPSSDRERRDRLPG